MNHHPLNLNIHAFIGCCGCSVACACPRVYVCVWGGGVDDELKKQHDYMSCYSYNMILKQECTSSSHNWTSGTLLFSGNCNWLHSMKMTVYVCVCAYMNSRWPRCTGNMLYCLSDQTSAFTTSSASVLAGHTHAIVPVCGHSLTHPHIHTPWYCHITHPVTYHCWLQWVWLPAESCCPCRYVLCCTLLFNWVSLC